MQIVFDSKVYQLDAVKKAAYRLIDKLTIQIEMEQEIIRCSISPISGKESKLDASIEQFKREVLDYELRLKIRKETEDVRNLILAYAFSKTGLQE